MDPYHFDMDTDPDRVKTDPNPDPTKNRRKYMSRIIEF